MINFQSMIQKATEQVERRRPKVQVSELVVDANNLLYRIGHKEGGNVDRMVVSTLEKLASLREWYGATTVHMVWEGVGTNWRIAMLPSYKSARTDSPLRQSVRETELRLRELLRITNIQQWDPVDAEGDDGFAALAKELQSKGATVGIYSSDRDLLQLAKPGLVLIVPQRGESDNIETHDSVTEKLGVEPRLIPDLKGLQGDPGDGIVGVPGLGKKAARELVSKHGSLAAVLAVACSPSLDRQDGESAAAWKRRVQSELGTTVIKCAAIRLNVTGAVVSGMVGSTRDDIELSRVPESNKSTSMRAFELRSELKSLGAGEYLMSRVDSLV